MKRLAVFGLLIACGDDAAAPARATTVPDAGSPAPIIADASVGAETDASSTPPPVLDAEGEPLSTELAVDTALNADCKGPFNCVLPNPEASDRNRITNPKTGTKDWPITGQPDILDGLGGNRGKVTEPSIQINYGQRKTIAGASYVYAFSVKTTNGQASSWVAESAVKDSLAAMPTVVARDPGKGDYEERFTITGGNPALYGDAKVVINSTSSNEAATDYLVRTGNVVNMLYALPGGGGVSNDTWPSDKSVDFRRARGVASVYVYLYTKGTADVIGTQRFIYGHAGDRFGWIARDALSPASPSPGPSLTFCCAKCANRDATHRVFQASDCTTSATAYCAAEPTRGAYESSLIGNCQP